MSIYRLHDGVPPIATTHADAVRLAVMAGAGNHWRNYMKDGALKDAVIDNTIKSARYQETEKEARRMRFCEQYGRRWQA
jgi:hypothetical protein